jgi:hypothetical protein
MPKTVERIFLPRVFSPVLTLQPSARSIHTSCNSRTPQHPVMTNTTQHSHQLQFTHTATPCRDTLQHSHQLQFTYTATPCRDKHHAAFTPVAIHAHRNTLSWQTPRSIHTSCNSRTPQHPVVTNTTQHSHQFQFTHTATPCRDNHHADFWALSSDPQIKSI